MFKGKRTCKILKEIRAQIAAENDIAFVTSECKHQGDCAGTCPKCEAEVQYLERELEKRAKLGKAVTVAGLAAAITATSISATSCDVFRPTAGAPLPDGDMAPPDYTDTLDGEPSDYATSEGEIDDMVTAGEPAIPTVYLPEFEEYRHLLDDTAALYDFLLAYCQENGTLTEAPTYNAMSFNNWSWSHTEEQENKYIEYFTVHENWNSELQQGEVTVVGLVFEPTEESKSGVPSYLWTAVVVETLYYEMLGGDPAP